MKKKKNKGALHLMLALCTMGSLAACSSDDVLSNIKETDNAVKIAVSTRSGETGTTENPWIVNDTIALSAIDYQTGTYQWNGSDWSSKKVLCWPKGQTQCNFMGYYPTTATNDGLSFTIPTDQSDAAKLHAADYMTTDRLYDVEKSSDPDKQLIDLNFYHRLAKVVINMTYTSEYDAATPIFTYENILSQGNRVNVIANSANDSLSTVEKTGEPIGVKPFKETNKEGKPCYTALVSPTTVDNSTTLMIFCVDDDLRNVTYPNTLKKLESGNVYTFNVKVGRDKVEMTGVTVTDWNKVDGGSNEDNIFPTLEQLLTDDYKALREKMAILTVDGPTLNPMAEPNCWRWNFATYFPKVTTLNITGTTISSFGGSAADKILHGNKTVKTVIGNDITSLPDDAFHYTSGVTTYTFPNLTEAGRYCFAGNFSLEEISLPKLKALSGWLFYATSLDKACFASLTDFSDVEYTFAEVNHLAFGSKEEFTFADGKTPADMYVSTYQESATDLAAKTILYLNKDGKEFAKADTINHTWRGTKFKAIKKYNEYPGKKN